MQAQPRARALRRDRDLDEWAFDDLGGFSLPGIDTATAPDLVGQSEPHRSLPGRRRERWCVRHCAVIRPDQAAGASTSRPRRSRKGIGSDGSLEGGAASFRRPNATIRSPCRTTSQRAKAEAVYNQQVQDYLAQRSSSSRPARAVREQSQTLQDALLAFQGQVSDVFNQEMAAAQPLLRQGRSSSEGVAA